MMTSTILLAIIISSLVGGILGFIGFTLLFKRRHSDYLMLTDENVTSEILNLRTRIQFLYIIGPIIGFGLGFFGLQSYENIQVENKKQVQEYVDKRIPIEASKEINTLYKRIKEERLLTESDLKDYTNKEYLNSKIDSKISNFYAQIQPNLLNLDNYRRYLYGYFTEKNIVDKVYLNGRLASKLDESKFLSEVSKLARTSDLDKKLDKQYEVNIKDYIQSKVNFAKTSDVNQLIDDKISLALTNNINSSNLAVKINELAVINNLKNYTITKTELTEDYLSSYIKQEQLIDELRIAFGDPTLKESLLKLLNGDESETISSGK